MAEELRLALSLLGSLAVGAVVLHGIWTVRKTSLEERKQAEQQKQQESPEIDEEEQEVQALKIKQMEIDFSDISQPDSKEGLPVVDMNVDSIYDQKNATTAHTAQSDSDEDAKGEMKSFLNHARQLDQSPDVSIDSSTQHTTVDTSVQSGGQQDAFASIETNDTPNIIEPQLSDADDVQIINTDDADDDIVVEGFSAYGNVRDDDVDAEQMGAFSSDFEEPNVQAQEKPQEVQSSEPSNQETEPKQEVLILFVDKPSGEMIEGAKLLPLLLTLGFKFGEMDFFHRHEQSSGHGEILFSLANMFNPGTFDIDHMEQVSTRGLTIFMTLPNAGEALQTFNMMHNAAKKIADEFGAQVLDAERQPLDVVRVRNYVDKIRKF